MNRDKRNPEEILDEAIAGVRNDAIDAPALEQARRRAWDHIVHASHEKSPPGPISSCADFQALLPEYRAGTLSEGRRLLVEDHTHECVACRRALHELSAPADRHPIALPVRRPTPSWRKYAVAASLLVTAGLAGWKAYDVYAPAPAGTRAVVQSISGNVYRIVAGVPQPLVPGAQIAEDEILRTAPGAHLMITLTDGSMVEVGERAELAVSMTRTDTTLRLDRGALIVQAAKRDRGHLYVSSADCRVAVTGTVFSVNRGMKGSRVAVVEGSVQVEHGGREMTLRSGDQVSTHASMESVPIQQEIAWSRNFNEHLVLLNEIANLKSKLDAIRLPDLRYGSRLLELVPADTVVFASIPNIGAALSDASRLFQEQMRLSPVLQRWFEGGGKGSEQRFDREIEIMRRLSEYIGDEVVVALSLGNGSKGHLPIVVAEIQKSGLREFLNTELTRLHAEPTAHGFKIFEGPGPIQGAARGDLVVVLRGNHVIAGQNLQAIEEVARNIDGPGARAFTSTDFGRRLADAFRRGTGVLVGFDLQRIRGLEGLPLKHERERHALLDFGADGARYLIAEQRQVGSETQRSAELSFAGARSGIASWLGAPASIGGLDFVSSDAQFVTAIVFKKPEQMIDEFSALQPDAGRIFEEARKHLGIDLKRDVAVALGGEVTFAIDGPLMPTISWKLVVDVNDPVRLQQTIEKVVNAANMVVQLSGRQGYALESTQVGPLTYYTVRSLDPSLVTEIHYVYTGGYLVIAPDRGLLAKAMQVRQAGTTLARSDGFRQLLPRDGYANVSALAYQNAGEWLGAVANTLGSAEQRTAGEVASKIGPILVCAYGEQDRIEVANKGSAWDVVMQSLLAPALNPRMLNQGTRRNEGSYR